MQRTPLNKINSSGIICVGSTYDRQNILIQNKENLLDVTPKMIVQKLNKPAEKTTNQTEDAEMDSYTKQHICCLVQVGYKQVRCSHTQQSKGGYSQSHRFP